MKGSGVGLSRVLTINRAPLSFEIPDIFLGKANKKFVKAPFVKVDDYLGEWYEANQDNSVEVIEIVTMKSSTYDRQRIELFHEHKTFKKYEQVGFNLNVQSGFVFTQTNAESNEQYIFYLMSVSPNSMSFTDAGGRKWTQYRLENSDVVAIPKNYTSEDERQQQLKLEREQKRKLYGKRLKEAHEEKPIKKFTNKAVKYGRKYWALLTDSSVRYNDMNERDKYYLWFGAIQGLKPWAGNIRVHFSCSGFGVRGPNSYARDILIAKKDHKEFLNMFNSAYGKWKKKYPKFVRTKKCSKGDGGWKY